MKNTSIDPKVEAPAMSSLDCPVPWPGEPAAMSRRGLLRGAGGIGAVVLSGLSLSACGGGDAQAATPPPAPPPPGPSASSITEISFASAVLGGTRYVKVYLPAGYAGSGLRYPVVYMLHGRGDSLSAWGRNQAMFDELIAAGTIPAFIGIMPDAPSSDRGGYYVDSAYSNAKLPGAKVETGIINELLPYIDANYRTIQHREARALAGYSMGAYGALRYALVYPELFSGSIVMSPAVYTPLPPAGSSTREFGAFGSGDTLFVDEIYRSKTYPALLPGFAAKNMALQMFIAAGDDEYKEPNPAEALNDIDMEAHLLFNRVSRIGSIKAQLRIVDGEHDWPIWQPALREGLPYIFKTMRKPE